MTQAIIEPPAGSDYRTVTGEANDILRELLGNVLGGFFNVPEKDSGVTITSYQFKLHVTYLEGLSDMLSKHGCRLNIYAQKDDDRIIRVYCEAVAQSVTEGEYNNDNGLDMTFTDNKMGITHLICYGNGELQNRQRIDLYLQEDGSVGTTQYYTGFYERTAVYENANADSLEADGVRRFKELTNKKTLDFDAKDFEKEMGVGDIVRGRHRASGIVLEKPIVRKILKYSGGVKSLEYLVKGE